jgi:hypothetical protein
MNDSSNFFSSLPTLVVFHCIKIAALLWNWRTSSERSQPASGSQSFLSQVEQRPDANLSSHEKQVTLRGGHTGEREEKEGS